MKALNSSMHSVNGAAYIVRATSYEYKMFMKWTNGQYATILVFLVTDVRTKQARVFIPRKSNICDQYQSSGFTQNYQINLKKLGRNKRSSLFYSGQKLCTLNIYENDQWSVCTNFVFLITDVRAKKARVFIPKKSNSCDQGLSSTCIR